MRLLICAGRHYADSRLCRRVLDAFRRMHPVRVLIHGGKQCPTGSATASRPNACATTSCCSTAVVG